MSHGMDQGGGVATGVQGPVEYFWEKVSKTKVRVMARLGGILIHSHNFDLNSATARANFAVALAKKLASTGQGTLAVEDVEENLLHLIEEAAQANEGVDAHPADYQVVLGDNDPEKDGLYLNTALGPVQLSNFVMTIDRDVAVHDGGEIRRRFEGMIILNGATTEFSLTSEEYALGSKFVASIFRAAGAKARILCKPEALCRAVSAMSSPIPKLITTDFGWTKDGDAYLAQGVRIDASGIHPVGPADPVRVDLDDEQCARHLDLMSLASEELAEVKTHVVTDLLRLNDRRVTFLLLAAVALAVLVRFSKGMNRPAVWLTGLTGGGKSFLGRLFANFFGDFPVADGARHGSWSSTGNFLQRQGYFFKDAYYLIDDYKPDVIQHREVVKILQNYADNSARGRLKADATTNVSRPIRGLLVSTGEDVPEHSASSVARTVVVRVPQAVKDITRGQRCITRCARYRGVTAGFMHHLIATGRTAEFAARAEAEMNDFYQGIAGQQNDVRIAGNFALLMAAFLEFAAFLGDVWPGWEQEAEAFRADLIAVRDEMLVEVRHQQASEVFLTTLGALVTNGHVQVEGWLSGPVASEKSLNRPTIGRKVVINPEQGAAFAIVTSLALAAVQDLLKRQGKPPLAATEKALVQQMASDGKLLDKAYQPIPPEFGGDHTWALKLEGSSRNAFRIWASELIGETLNTGQGTGGHQNQEPGGQPLGGTP